MKAEKHLTELSDKELENLHGNAIRLAQSGTGAQQADAEWMLPLIGAEVDRRAKLRTAALAEVQPQNRHRAAQALRDDGTRKAAGGNKTAARWKDAASYLQAIEQPVLRAICPIN